MVVESLYAKLHKMLVEELDDLRIGYPYNKERMEEMKELLYALFYIEDDTTPKKDGEKAIRYFL